jgi:HD-like signal output (HDOD) protein
MASIFTWLATLISGKPAARRPAAVQRPAARSPVPPTAARATVAQRTVAVVPPAQDPAALASFVASVRDLPLFSGTALRILQSVGSEDVSTDELARMVSADAGLAAALLRMVNSTYYMPAHKVSTVGAAITVLGLDQVRRTVVSAVSQRSVAAYLKDSRVVRDFWRHLLLTAAMSRHLAERDRLDGEVAYMAGLMHEVGRLAMLIRHPHLDNLLLRVRGDDDGLDIDRERAHFGFDHARAGGALLEHWGLPLPIVQAAYDHGGDERPADPLSAAVWRANLLAHDMVAESVADDVELPWMTAVGLTVAQRRRIFEEIAVLESAQR